MFNYLDESTPHSPISYLDDYLDPNFNLLEQLPYYCSSYYQLPSPLIYNEISNLGDFLSLPELSSVQQGGSEANTSCMIDDSSVFDTTNVTKESNKGASDHDMDTTMGASEGSTSTKRSRLCKKGDRHSKIRTAHGLRDRRMRLSLKVARPFFMLQDMLGYDKASTTVEWLLMQAKRAIEEQLQSKNNNNNNNNVVGTSSNNCDHEEVLDQSIIIEETRARSFKGSKKSSSTTTTSVTKDGAKEKKRKRGVATKESRKEARDRARKRTLERMQRGRSSSWGGFNVDVSISTFNYQQNNGDMHQNGESYSTSMQQNTMGGIQ